MPSPLAQTAGSRSRRPRRPAPRQAEISRALEEESPPSESGIAGRRAVLIRPARSAGRTPDNAVLRNAAIAALTRQGPYAIQQVTGMLADLDPDVAMFACQALGETERGKRAGDPAAAHARVVNVVQAAIEALGRLRAPMRSR